MKEFTTDLKDPGLRIMDMKEEGKKNPRAMLIHSIKEFKKFLCSSSKEKSSTTTKKVNFIP